MSLLMRGVLANLAVSSFAHTVQVIRHGLKKIAVPSRTSSRGASPEPGWR
jgi:hypothetical protein